jgi:hypothetical protein
MHDWPKPDHDQDRCLPLMREGDIVVTRVARHYALGRVQSDRSTQTPVEAQERRSDALGRACVLAGADHQVFLYDNAGNSACILINCQENPDDATT